MRIKWKQFTHHRLFPSIKVSEPYYLQWVLWCWHKPIWIGLPLFPFLYVFLVIDVIIGLAWVITRWGGKENIQAS